MAEMLYLGRAPRDIIAMALLKIARMGRPVLLERAEEVADPTAREVRRLIADMIETMEDARGAGLAAPQVHVGLRVVIFHAPEERLEGDEAEETETAPLTILVNPEIEPLSEEMTLGWEGCLSVPGLTGQVRRYSHIRYRALTPEGSRIEREAAGFHARVVQHECDHLDGILYPMRMTDLSSLMFVEEMRHHIASAEDAETDEAEVDGADTSERIREGAG